MRRVDWSGRAATAASKALVISSITSGGKDAFEKSFMALDRNPLAFKTISVNLGSSCVASAGGFEPRKGALVESERSGGCLMLRKTIRPPLHREK